MRMPQLPGERGFILELRAVYRAELRIPEDLALDRLERDLAPGEGVLGEVYRSGRALAERLLDVVFAYLKAQVHLEGCARHVALRSASRRLEPCAGIVS